MFTILLATATLLHTTTTLPAVAPHTMAPTPVAATQNPDNEHLVKARQALDAGDFDLARREFVIAAAIERDAGRLPVDATFGLAHVLYSQSYNREAARVLNRLADEASRAGDANTEARALADAMWLNTQSKQYSQARADASRLRALLKSDKLTPETRQHVTTRTS